MLQRAAQAKSHVRLPRPPLPTTLNLLLPERRWQRPECRAWHLSSQSVCRQRHDRREQPLILYAETRPALCSVEGHRRDRNSSLHWRRSPQQPGAPDDGFDVSVGGLAAQAACVARRKRRLAGGGSGGGGGGGASGGTGTVQCGQCRRGDSPRDDEGLHQLQGARRRAPGVGQGQGAGGAGGDGRTPAGTEAEHRGRQGFWDVARRGQRQLYLPRLRFAWLRGLAPRQARADLGGADGGAGRRGPAGAREHLPAGVHRAHLVGGGGARRSLRRRPVQRRWRCMGPPGPLPLAASDLSHVEGAGRAAAPGRGGQAAGDPGGDEAARDQPGRAGRPYQR